MPTAAEHIQDSNNGEFPGDRLPGPLPSLPGAENAATRYPAALALGMLILMRPERFQLALQRLDNTSWSDFEKLASIFLASDFPDLRSVACPGGDGGRDSELFSPTGQSGVVLQYSVTPGWQTKLTKTAKRVAALKPVLLIFVSNQEIGARADNLKGTIRSQYDFLVDIRDISWFLDRTNTTPERVDAAEALAVKHVDPFLASKGIFSSKASPLTSDEAKTAFIYLGLQWEDDTQDKGLTKLAFEALVCSALHGSDGDHRIPSSEVLTRVQALLPTHPATDVDARTVSALSRLKKRRIRYSKATDDYCLAHEERLRLADRLASHESQERHFINAIDHALTDLVLQDDRPFAIEQTRGLLEQFLFERGEQFALAARTGVYEALDLDSLHDVATRQLGKNPTKPHATHMPIAISAARQILLAPDSTIQPYLRTIADSYTLFAFLKETTDVQAVVSKMFSTGDIWLDTTIALPVLAETLLDEEQRRLTALLKAAVQAGLTLHVTDGVLEEVERHMNRSMICSRTTNQTWKGNIPFLYSMYIELGNASGNFLGWLENFRGTERPIDDIADYLSDFYSVVRTPLVDDVKNAPDLFRQRVLAHWQVIQDTRRKDSELDQLTANKLATHDTENYVGVLQRRKSEIAEPFGFKSWFLTLDRQAYNVDRDVRREFPGQHGSPLLTPDFLSNYLSFGPMRGRLTRAAEQKLPVLIDQSILTTLPPELLDVAERKRAELAGMPDHRIRREVRDSLDAAKRRSGKIAQDGLAGVERDLRAQRAK